eukprot:5363624-Pyramimonas_sp.AAC.2
MHEPVLLQPLCARRARMSYSCSKVCAQVGGLLPWLYLETVSCQTTCDISSVIHAGAENDALLGYIQATGLQASTRVDGCLSEALALSIVSAGRAACSCRSGSGRGARCTGGPRGPGPPRGSPGPAPLCPGRSNQLSRKIVICPGVRAPVGLEQGPRSLPGVPSRKLL